MDSIRDWEAVYQRTKPQDLPWNAGGPDPDLAHLVESGRIPIGQALDIGTGPGHDAVYLMSKGFTVVGLDISPSAITLARENASRSGFFGFFQQGDIRQIPIEDHYFDFANDRGCFHVLEEADRPLAVKEIARVLRRNGLFLLRVFSDKEPGGPGPHRFTKHELETLFKRSFTILEWKEGLYKGSASPQSYLLLMQKK